MGPEKGAIDAVRELWASADVHLLGEASHAIRAVEGLEVALDVQNVAVGVALVAAYVTANETDKGAVEKVDGAHMLFSIAFERELLNKMRTLASTQHCHGPAQRIGNMKAARGRTRAVILS